MLVGGDRCFGAEACQTDLDRDLVAVFAQRRQFQAFLHLGQSGLTRAAERGFKPCPKAERHQGFGDRLA